MSPTLARGPAALTIGAAAVAAATLLSFPAVVEAMEPAMRHARFNGKHPRIATSSISASSSSTPGAANCTTNWFTQQIDHFSWSASPTGALTYQQRYLTYDAWYNPNNGPIFLYLGNEADVTLYADHSGLIWENAQAAGAYIVFAEHRYFGLSQPFGDASSLMLQYLTHEQALADYATLITSLQKNLSISAPVIVFGGSYGGMLAAWGRTKYPAIFAGAIAASAPILFFNGMEPAYDNQTYWQVVTADATAAGGAAPACANNVRAAFAAMFAAANTPQGLANLTSTFGMCSPLQGPSDVSLLALFHLNAWDTLAMGNYPFASSYLTGGGPLLPPWPVRAACSNLADPALATGDPWKLLAAFNAAGNVFNNATMNVECYTLPTDVWEDGIWDYLWCTETLPEETYFTTNGNAGPGGDMFYPRVYSLEFVAQHCLDTFGVVTRPEWIRASYGSGSRFGGTNIVFSNGGYDPWSSAGVKIAPNPATTVVFIPDGAHHLDLMFSNPADPPSVIAARATEVEMINKWVVEWFEMEKAIKDKAAKEL